MLRSVKVQDYMTTNLITFTPKTDLFDAIHSMLKHRISGAPVLDEGGKLVGMISESDCLKHILSGSYYEEVGGHVGEFMTREPDTIRATTDIIEVAGKFIREKRRRFPVMDEYGKLVGQISRRDVLRAVADYNTQDRKPREVHPHYENLQE